MEVVVRNVSIGDGKPKICVPIMGKTRDEVLKETKNILTYSPDILEWRADFLEEEVIEGEVHNAILREIRELVKDIPILYAFRTLEEGGKEIDEEAYKELILDIANAEVCDLLDVEVFKLKTKARDIVDEIHSFSSVKVIGSYHNFELTPDTAELVYRFSVIDNCNADILKISTMPRKKKDVMRIMTATILTHTRPNCKPLVGISMGRLGRPTRLLGGFTGSAITFAEAGKPSAPGQVDIRDMKEMIESLERIL